MKKLFALFIACLQSHCLFSLTLSTMSEADQKTCGIEKLSPEEKQALDGWLAKATTPPIQEKGKIQHGEFAVTANVITLENGVIYDIPSRSRKKTMGWKVGDKVRLQEPIRTPHFKLENIANKQTIGAKISKAKKNKSE